MVLCIYDFDVISIIFCYTSVNTYLKYIYNSLQLNFTLIYAAIFFKLEAVFVQNLDRLSLMRNKHKRDGLPVEIPLLISLFELPPYDASVYAGLFTYRQACGVWFCCGTLER